MREQIRGKLALVTGASRGLGRGVALALAHEGVKVAVHYNSNEAKALEVCEEIKKLGVDSRAYKADVADAEQVNAMMKAVQKDLGTVDILVNCAGVATVRSIDEITVKDWNETMAINLTSAFLTTQAVLPGMLNRKWGRIIYFGSSAAQTGGTVGAHYSASKAGIAGLTHYYATNTVKEGITVNNIAPGPFSTDMTAQNPKIKPEMVPVGRFGEVDEICGIVMMLINTGYMTGQTISVNGGLYYL